MLETFRIFLMVIGGLQALLMFIDEGIFHHGRGLGAFERWGHVADTSLFLAALLVPAFCLPTQASMAAFIVLGCASCLLITKDEWIHSEACKPVEQWCHAMLFIMHGPILGLIGLVWYLGPNSWELKALPAAVLVFGIYQHLYWNVYNVRSNDK
ncbi:MAG: hypothetical protein H7249_18725 [Chitinophagaceae bacterium]|nr:hypothetical protein [Oligoflexus sp.]